MGSLSITVDILNDHFRREIWSREPHRCVELNIELSNDANKYAKLVSFEIMLPEDAVLNFNADSWKPSHKHLAGTRSYVVWSTGNILNTESGQGYGIPAHGRLQQKLSVNLNPRENPIEALWRVYQGEQEYPSDDFGSQKLDFEPYTPSL